MGFVQRVIGGGAVLLLLAFAGCGVQEAPPMLQSEVVVLNVPPVKDRSAQALLDSLFQNHVSFPGLLPASDEGVQHWVDSVLAALSLDEKIGQLFIVELPQQDLRRLVYDGALRAVEKYGVGGFLVRRLVAPDEVFEVTRRLQAASSLPLFFAADYERGAGRFNNALTELPSNMAIGATRDTLFASIAGRLTAIECRAIGINLLFAPVVDVNNNVANPIINIRSYGEDAALVARMAAAFVQEAEANGVLTTLKHFPGHGNTEVDSHVRMGVLPGDRAALNRVELHPYHILIGRRRPPAAVMSAHLWVPAIDTEPLPATFSRRLMSDLLRDSLGFDGLVITDDVKMGALNRTYSLADRVVLPLQAGANLILTPDNLGRAVQAVREALQEGRLTEAALDVSVRRILSAKARAGLHRERYASPDLFAHIMEQGWGQHIAETMAAHAVTVLKEMLALPLRPAERIALVQLTNYRGSESIGAAMEAFNTSLGGIPDSLHLRLDDNPSEREQAKVLARVGEADVVVLALYLRLQSGRGEAGLLPGQAALVQALVAQEVPLVLVTFGNPYAVTTFVEADAHVVAYDQTIATVQAVAGVLRGVLPASGRLPITVDPYPYGSGIGAGRR